MARLEAGGEIFGHASVSARLQDPEARSDRECVHASRPMRSSDLPRVMEIERSAYDFPWSEGILRDCLQVGYCCWVIEHGQRIDAYGIMQVAVGEAHILNLCADPQMHGQGLGRSLLRCLMTVAGEHSAESVFLEVRPTNEHALSLYRSEGFRTVGHRRAYYPGANGREDAFILSCSLTDASIDPLLFNQP